MKISVLGAGTWGAALAKLFFENGHEVALWSKLDFEIESLKEGKHKNLPRIEFPDGINYTTNLEQALAGSDIVIFVTASQYIRQTATAAADFIKSGAIVASAAKGIEKETLFTTTEIIENEIRKQNPTLDFSIAALTGPTHAEEVAAKLPTSIVAASEDEGVAEILAKAISNGYMRAYTNTDVRGVEISGAFKNVIALAAGITEGMGFGDNAKAMLMTRGIAEIARIGLAIGCKRRSFMGLAGIGDLIVTCTSRHSRNNRCGFLIGKGYSYEEAEREIGMVVEGYHALEAGIALAKKYEVEMPITEAVFEVIKKGASPKEAMHRLMTRDLKSELGT